MALRRPYAALLVDNTLLQPYCDGCRTTRHGGAEPQATAFDLVNDERENEHLAAAVPRRCDGRTLHVCLACCVVACNECHTADFNVHRTDDCNYLHVQSLMGWGSTTLFHIHQPFTLYAIFATLYRLVKSMVFVLISLRALVT